MAHLLMESSKLEPKSRSRLVAPYCSRSRPRWTARWTWPSREVASEMRKPARIELPWVSVSCTARSAAFIFCVTSQQRVSSLQSESQNATAVDHRHLLIR